MNKKRGAAKIAASFEDSDVYRLGADTYVVAHKGLSRDVARCAGIFKDEGEIEPGEVSGVVFKLNGSYTGYANQDIWEWLEEADKESQEPAP